MVRRLVLLALAAVAALAVAVAPASAINSKQQFTATASPNKGGTKSKPQAVSLKINPFFTDITADNDAPFATDTATVLFPKEAVFGGKYFPSCAAAKVLASASGCPAGSKVGTANVDGGALGVVEKLKAVIYNGPGGNQVELLVDGTDPLTIHAVIPGKLSKASGKYGLQLVFDIPADLESPAPGTFATILKFDASVPAKTIKKGKKKYAYAASSGCLTGTYNWGYIGKYTDGSTQTVETTQPCKK